MYLVYLMGIIFHTRTIYLFILLYANNSRLATVHLLSLLLEAPILVLPHLHYIQIPQIYRGALAITINTLRRILCRHSVDRLHGLCILREYIHASLTTSNRNPNRDKGQKQCSVIVFKF